MVEITCRIRNNKGKIYYGEYVFDIGKDTLEIIDFGFHGTDDSTDLRILEPGIKIKIKTELKGFYFNRENPDSSDFILFSNYCIDTTTVKNK